MENKELITIGIPIYNMENSIIDAINSCLNQTYENIEILIVNDGSTDNSIQKIKENIKDSRVRIYERFENGGVCRAMNSIVDEAKGIYIAFLDADDMMMPTRIEKQYTAIEEKLKENNGNMVASFCGSEVHDLSKNKIYNIYPKNLFKSNVAHGFGGGTGHSMYRAEDIKKLGKFDTNFSRSADTALCLNFLLNNGEYAMVNEPLIIYNFMWTEDKKAASKKEMETFKKIIKKIKKNKAYKLNNNYLKRFIENKKLVKKYKLFNIFTLLKIKVKKGKRRYYLFGFIPILVKRKRS